MYVLPLSKSFPWAQPVTQMGCRLVSVSELGCYRWVYYRQTSNVFFKYLTTTIKGKSEKDGHGWTPWRDFRSWWSPFCFGSPFLCPFNPDPIGCDALNTRVSGDKVYLSLILINQPKTARSTFTIECSRTRTFLLDYCLPNSYLGQLLSHIVGRVLYRYVSRKSQFFDFFLTICVLGQLFLGYFSGPVEGIIMIVIIFTITGFYGLKLTRFFVILYLLTLFIIYYLFLFTGPSFWDQDLWKITHLDHIPFLPNLRHLW